VRVGVATAGWETAVQLGWNVKESSSKSPSKATSYIALPLSADRIRFTLRHPGRRMSVFKTGTTAVPIV
jgi:hypothetical protein